MQFKGMDRVVILGASRGLGAELVKYISAESTCAVFGFGRKDAPLQALQDRFPLFEYQLADFSLSLGQNEVVRYLREEDYSKVICVAGGGPYGRFEERAWKDHQWAWEVTFQFPALVLHTLLAAKRDVQVIMVGSAVAEAAPDPFGASYAAAKHALKGLVMSVRAENPEWDLRLFSPGYMNTEMLPKNAAVRQRGVYEPSQIAQELWQWSLAATEDGHKLYSPHPR